jgi:GNAT superfamily N-acetyltransferase
MSFHFQFDNMDLKMVHKAYYHCCDTLDVFKMYNIKEYLSGYGLCVDRHYRGRNIATEMLKARAPFLKALGLKVTCTMFSGIGAQLAAKNAGYDEVFSIRCDELQKLFPYFDFTKTPETEFIKIFALKITE